MPATDLAIVRVLAAQRAASDELQHCRSEADALIESSRLQAARIHERASRRLTRQLARLQADADQQLVQLSLPLAIEPPHSPDDLHVIERAVALLAAELTGGDR